MKPVTKIAVIIGISILLSSYVAVWKWRGAIDERDYQIALNLANKKIRELERSHQADIDDALLSWQRQKLKQARLQGEKDKKIAALTDDLNYIYWVYNIEASDSGLPENPHKQRITQETSSTTLIRDTLKREIDTKHQLTACINAIESMACYDSQP